MWSGLLWPVVVVLFEVIVFLTAVFLIRLAARDRQREVQELEHEEQVAYQSPVTDVPPEQNAGQIPAMG